MYKEPEKFTISIRPIQGVFAPLQGDVDIPGFFVQELQDFWLNYSAYDFEENYLGEFAEEEAVVQSFQDFMQALLQSPVWGDRGVGFEEDDEGDAGEDNWRSWR